MPLGFFSPNPLDAVISHNGSNFSNSNWAEEILMHIQKSGFNSKQDKSGDFGVTH